MSESIGRKIPFTDIEVEERFVTTKLFFPEFVSGVDVDPDDLCVSSLREIYKACVYLQNNLDKWSITDVLEYLKQENKLGSGVDEKYITGLYKDPQIILDGGGQNEATKIKHLARCRRKRSRLMDAVVRLDDEDYKSADEIILSIADDVTTPSDSPIYNPGDLADITCKALVSMKSGKKLVVPTGVEFLDRYIGGLFPGGMFTIAGYSGTGKSQTGLLIARKVAQGGYPSGIISVEDPPLITGSRLVSQVTGELSPKNMFVGEYTHDRIDKMIGIIDRHRTSLCTLPVYIAHCVGAEPHDVVDDAIRLIKQKGCKVIVLDYLQRVRVDLKLARYDKVISDVAKQMKSLCARYGTAFVLVSQLTRPKEGNIYKKPYPNQLKESGDLEAESETILMLWRDSPDVGASTLCWIPKSKIGNEGIVGRLTTNRTTGMIDSIEEMVYDREEKENHRGYSGQYKNYTDVDMER